jgi:SPP1 family predicted phage head-tail adaptor
MAGGTTGAGGRSVQIKIQSNPRADDGFGGQDNVEGNWADKFEIWANMKRTSGRELFTNRQKESRSLYKFTMVFPLGETVLTTDRILVGDRAFDIHDVNNVEEMNRELVVIAEEGVPD